MIRTILVIFLVLSTLNAGYFGTTNDMCDGNKYFQCENNYNAVRNLQIALNSDKKLGVKLKVDGTWGEETKSALMAFQENYGLEKADGWVGKRTKEKLDTIYSKVKFPKDIKVVENYKTKKCYSCYSDFRQNVNLRKSFEIYEDKKLLKRANGRNTKLTVDVSEQRVRLYVDGKVALCSPCTTGAKRKFEPNTKIYRDKRTPMGTFKITEKIADKRSSIFGEYYRGKKLVYKGDKRKFSGNKKGLTYQGASLKNWMRLTSSGIGLHASKYIKRYPGTNGCIRLPYKVSQTIFKNVRQGTPVSIVN
ncbi:L,D-transpeptidase family protein [Sulfurovum sp. zt1-1]|uniref:L,D-transpeptidase family protein n=1 Tax=Sulfurovum zhangzhouensis TaxID=3019067 RepID=A0ABT7QY59_9BACT|nr:L,D-transpeptidase family protein [Sulfurovum zhangzhouensis]MDM5271773.1 L,D-transpeptidase family protein [Sulfurovum zhangzhouensis]